ncbi:MAG: hypothetical protein IJE43_06940 [Alphaproteobacteria bacterium]|nr:hypothetical protein [Alphaproteobacteria bacterium]
MKRKIKGIKSLTLGILAIVSFSCLLFGITKAVAENNSTLITSEVDLTGTYYRSDLFEVPKMNFTVGNETVVAEAVVTSPSGSKFTGEQFYLDSRGEYTIEYTATLNGKKYSKIEKFIADLKVFETSKGEEEVQVSSNPYYTEAEGQLINLSPGSTFYYNEVIDATAFTGATPIVNFYVIPDVQGTEDISTVYIKLTDKYNPDNYLIFKGLYSAVAYGYPAVFWNAGNDEMGLLGIDMWSGRVSGGWTGCVRSSFCAHEIYTAEGAYNSACDITLNYATKSVTAAGTSTPVIDLDNPEHFDIIWEGFTTGECYLSMWADGYKSTSPAKILVTAIAGKETKNIANVAVEDTEAPVINIDFGEYSKEELPVGIAGEVYPLFDAVALDVAAQNVKYPYTVKAFMNYEKYGEKYPVPVLPNGRILPNNPGTVTVFYEAKDIYGNKGVNSYSFEVKNSISDIKVVYNGETNCKAGELLKLDDYSLEGISGKPVVNIYVVENGENKILKDARYRPAQEGVLKVVYEIEDYLHRVKAETIEINVSGKTGFMEDIPVLPRYFMSDVQTILQMPTAWDYTTTDGVKGATVKIRTIDANGDNLLNDGKYTPKVSNSGDLVKISYILNLADGTNIETPYVEVPVIITRSGPNNKAIDMENYFWSADEVVTATANDKSIALTTSNDASVEFIKVLLADDFHVDFNIAKESSFDKITFILTDAEDPSIQLHMSIFKAIVRHDGKDVEKTVLSLGTKKYKLSSTIDGGGADFQISYDNTDLTVKESSTSKISIPFDVFGKSFKGFTSDRVYLTIKMEVSGESTLEIQKINSTNLNNLSSDVMFPIIQIPLGYGGNYSIGESATLNYAIAGDVLGEIQSFTLTVRSPSGQIVTSNEGIELNQVDPSKTYTITFKEYGFYSITYTATDTSNRTQPFTWGFTINDEIAPVIDLEKDFPKTAKLNSSITLPEALAIDNLDLDIPVYVNVLRPDLSFDSVAHGKYTFTEVGEYKFTFVAIDKDGNVHMETYSVIVSD